MYLSAPVSSPVEKGVGGGVGERLYEASGSSPVETTPFGLPSPPERNGNGEVTAVCWFFS
jgi:hypothetical protein